MTERIIYKLNETNIQLSIIAEALQDISKKLETRQKEDEQ